MIAANRRSRPKHAGTLTGKAAALAAAVDGGAVSSPPSTVQSGQVDWSCVPPAKSLVDLRLGPSEVCGSEDSEEEACAQNV